MRSKYTLIKLKNKQREALKDEPGKKNSIVFRFPFICIIALIGNCLFPLFYQYFDCDVPRCVFLCSYSCLELSCFCGSTAFGNSKAPQPSSLQIIIRPALSRLLLLQLRTRRTAGYCSLSIRCSVPSCPTPVLSAWLGSLFIIHFCSRSLFLSSAVLLLTSSSRFFTSDILFFISSISI